jgi:hypothetical protein
VIKQVNVALFFEEIHFGYLCSYAFQLICSTHSCLFSFASVPCVHMWCLSGETSAYYLLARREYSVGRLVGQDVVLEEASVSRLHASFVLDSDGTLHVVDKSKFGTKLNGERLAGNVKTRVSVGDVLLFGVAKKLSVSMLELSVCFAPSSDAALAERAVAGDLALASAQACTHLVLTRTAVLPKMLMGLVMQKNVVCVSWMEALLQRNLASDPVPKEALFCPVLPEGSALPNANRLTVFRGCVFCFPSDKSWQQFSALCRAAGAQSVLPPGQMPGSNENAVFVMPNDDDLNNQ